MVDDEEIVRRGFRRKIDWERLGFEFLEPCENGEQALDAIRSLHPDVVMTDIYMPKVDGLAVAAYAAEHHPEIVVVILSGYDEFEYAQKAIRSKVFEYVLKPVTSRDLTGLLGRLKERLDADQRSRQDESALMERADQGADLLKARRLTALVTGAQDAMEEAEFEELFGFSPRGLSCAVLVAERDPAARAAMPGGARLSEIVAAGVGPMRRALPFSPGEDREALLIFEPDPVSCARVAGSAADKVAAADGFPAIVGLSGVRESWTEVPLAFKEAVAALSYRLVAGTGKVFRYPLDRADDPSQIAELKTRSEKLSRSVVAGDIEESETRSADLFGMMEASLLSPQRVQHDIRALFAGILDAFAQLGISPGTVSRDLGMDYDLVVQRLRTAEEARSLLGRLAAYAGAILDARNLPAPEWKVRDFKDYVARHYGEKSLSVQTVAESLSISASYLSKLVKRRLDQSVIDYLTEYRMERAKELLATSDLMTYEIAEATGYPDARYFSSTFKRHVGVTPSEYRSARRRKTDGS